MQDVNFRYILKSNHNVEISGTVHIPSNEDADDTDFEITFDGNGQLPVQNLFVHHYGVEITGRTNEQNHEIDKLKEIFTQDFLFLTRISDFAYEGTNGIVELEEAYLVVDDFDFETWVEGDAE